MDARSKEIPQSYQSGIKRPWEDDTKLPAQQNGSRNVLQSGKLPPIDAAPFSQHTASGTSDNWGIHNDQYARNGRVSIVKRLRYEGNNYNGMPRVDLDTVWKIPPSQAHYPIRHDHKWYTQDTSTLGQLPQATVNGRVDLSQDVSNICRQGRRQTTVDHEEESLPECCEHCQKNPELALVTQACSIGLTQLAETLRSGIDSKKRGINPAHLQLRLLPSGDPPPIIDFGSKQTLHWLLTKINKVNEVADKFVQGLPPGASKLPSKKDVPSVTNRITRDGSSDIMKRRIDDDHQRPLLNNLDSSDFRMHQRRRSLVISASEELPPLRTQSPYQHIPSHIDSTSQRLSNMNPPPAPNRQLLSSPGRAFPSPTSVNLSSASGSASYGGRSQHNTHATNNVLPPITGAQSSDSALQAHTAALQHEASIQKIALSSLQSKHDKLLAAFSRSQSRASALEKKHQVSDTEIFTLTEEKARLQTQVLELEGDVEDLAKSRDSYRQAAVQGGAQYIEIVKMASQLEEKTGEERKNWNKLKLEMVQKINELSNVMKTRTQDSRATSIPEGTEKNIPPSTEQTQLKGSISTELAKSTGDEQLGIEDDRVDVLKAETERLQKRCGEMEVALRAVRQESRSMEGIMKALSRAGKRILLKVENISQSPHTYLESQPDSRPEIEIENDRKPLEEGEGEGEEGKYIHNS